MTTTLPPITDRSPEANMQSSRRFLEHAMLELAKDPPERLQASEKSWGALSQAVKAVAKDRRWRNDSHFRTHAILNQIIYEQWYGTALAEEMRRDFLAVQSLHSNYHENVSDVPTIEVGIRAAQRLVDRLEQVRRDGPRPAVIKDADVQERLAYLLEINQLDQSVIDRVIPIGKRSDDGFKKDGMLGRVVSRVRRGKEIPGSYATSWGMPRPSDGNNRDDTDNGSNPNEDGRGGRPVPRPRPGGQSPSGGQSRPVPKGGKKAASNIQVKPGKTLPLTDAADEVSSRSGRQERRNRTKTRNGSKPTEVNIRM